MKQMKPKTSRDTREWRKILYPTTPLSPKASTDFKEKRESGSDKSREIEALTKMLEILEKVKD